MWAEQCVAALCGFFARAQWTRTERLVRQGKAVMWRPMPDLPPLENPRIMQDPASLTSAVAVYANTFSRAAFDSLADDEADE